MAAQTPSGVWLGQDGHDMVGTTRNGPPNEVQDLHFAISNLPADRTVVKATVGGYGGGQWVYNGPWGPYPAGWIQAPGATTADLYIEPYMVETGRLFTITLEYDNGSSAVFSIQGGSADPNLRMPGLQPVARWVGQDGLDLTGPGPSVGPDGIQDAHLTISNLSSQVGVASLNVTTASGAGWSFGNNPGLLANAELKIQPGDATKGELYLNPIPGLTGQLLTLTVVYTDGKSVQTTVAAGATDPELRMPTSAPPSVTWGTIAARWVGQDGLDLSSLGDVHISLTGLPAGRTVVSAMLSDEARGSWQYEANDTNSILAFRRSTTDPSRAELGFPPIRDETGGTLTLRLVLDDGSMLATQFAGGSVDLARRAPETAPTSIVAQPGDNLVALVGQFGSIHLSAGVYPVNRPLLLSRPITITADPGATILFAQGANDPAWATAINIENGNTTLDGFAIRFAGSIRWTTDINGGRSVIGNSDRVNGGYKSALVDIRLTNLDLVSPEPSSSWEEAAHLIWMTGAQSGVISGNTLRGGTTEFNNGPWVVTGNDYRGTLPNTFSQCAFAGHYTRDVLFADNTAQPVGVSGKTWRFLVLTQAGYRDVVRDNTVVGIGPMDGDPIPHPNAPEVILTEAYRLYYEGAVTSISSDGWVVQIPSALAEGARTGDVVAILSGPEAGQWRLIAQALSPTTFLLSAPMATENREISLTRGFVEETFQGNYIDARGSSMATNLILAGSHFGTKVIDNHLLGGYQGLRIVASASESPVMWGWSRVPIFGGLVQGNVLEDNLQGGVFEVEQSSYTKRSWNRTYMSISLLDNTVVWSDAFLSAVSRSGRGVPLTIMVGNPLTTDTKSLIVSAQGNGFQGPSTLSTLPTWQIGAAVLNGQPASNQAMTFLPVVTLTAPSGLGLIRDTGLSSSDGVTNDGRLRFEPVEGAAGYEYSLTGEPGSYRPVPGLDPFVPDGLVQGVNTIYLRAYDARGQRGPMSSVRFVFDTIAPGAVDSLIAFDDGFVQFRPTGAGDGYEYRLDGEELYLFLGATSTFTLDRPALRSRSISVRSVDLAGNISPEMTAPIVARPVSNEPPPTNGPPPIEGERPTPVPPVIPQLPAPIVVPPSSGGNGPTPSVPVTPPDSVPAEPKAPIGRRAARWRRRWARLSLARAARPIVAGRPPWQSQPKVQNGSESGSRPGPHATVLRKNRLAFKDQLRSLVQLRRAP